MAEIEIGDVYDWTEHPGWTASVEQVGVSKAYVLIRNEKHEQYHKWMSMPFGPDFVKQEKKNARGVT